MDSQQQIAALFCVTAAYYSRPISDEVALMYAHDLADFQPTVIGDTLQKMRRDPKRRSCPLPAEVRAAARPAPNEVSAEELAARIVGAVSRFGYPNSTRARAHLGEAGWAAIEDLGGWSDVCSRLRADQVGTFTAQARELCRAHLARQDAAAPAPVQRLGERRQAKRLQSLVSGVGSW